MTQEIGRVVVDPVRSSALELFPAVAAREETHAECAGAACGQKVPAATSTPSRLLPAIKRSGSGLACWTWSRVITGTCAGSTPIASRAGRAAAIRPLVATVQ